MLLSRSIIIRLEQLATALNIAASFSPSESEKIITTMFMPRRKYENTR